MVFSFWFECFSLRGIASFEADPETERSTTTRCRCGPEIDGDVGSAFLQIPPSEGNHSSGKACPFGHRPDESKIEKKLAVFGCAGISDLVQVDHGRHWDIGVHKI